MAKYKRMKSADYWFNRISKPIIGLAPMHGFTNSAFRLKCRKAGAEVVFSEMVASEAIIRRIPKAFEMMKFEESERPVVIQIFGSNPETMKQAAEIVEREFSPDGIDINFGCPVQKAAKQGFGAVQLRDRKGAIEVIKAVKSSVKLPLSVKMRLVGPLPEETVDFVGKLRDEGVSLITIHGRTPTQKYRGQANWEILHEVKKRFSDLVVLGSGDIRTLADLKNKIGNLDGVLIGRAAKINSEIFKELRKIKL